MLRSQGTSIRFSGTLAVKLSDRHAASVASDPAMLKHNGDSRGICSNQGGSNLGERTRKLRSLQRCKPFDLYIQLEGGFGSRFYSLNAFSPVRTASSHHFIVVVVCGCPAGSCMFCINFTNHGS